VTRQHPTTGALANFAPWTSREDATLRTCYARGGIKEAVAAIPARSQATLFHRAQRIGLKRRLRWTEADDQRTASSCLDLQAGVHHATGRVSSALAVPSQSEYKLSAPRVAATRPGRVARDQRARNGYHVIRVYRYRLYPTRAQEATMHGALDMLRELYNASLQERIAAHRAGIKLSCYSQQAELREVRAVRPALEVAAVVGSKQVEWLLVNGYLTPLPAKDGAS